MSIYIIPGIILLLVLLASYAFISHTLERRRLHRQRLLTAMKVRKRNFKYMITGFPPHFLSNELVSLVYRALIDTCEHLAKLEPSDPKHLNDLQAYSNQLTTIKQETNAKRVLLENPEQIKEVRQHLQELHRFVAQQAAIKAITATQAGAFDDQIKRLALQSSVDGYIFQGKQAQQIGKLRLAIHYFGLARKLLTPENTSHAYDKQIEQLSGAITILEEKAGAHPEKEDDTEGDSLDPKIATTASGPAGKEWENFNTNEDEWKKKQLYD